MVSSFNTGDESNYNVDSVLRSLGELEKTGEGKKHNNSSSSNNASNNSSSTTNGSKTSNGSSGKLLNGKHAVNGNVKARRKSNDKNADVDADDKKSTSDDEASTDASSNYSSAAELNQLPDTFTAKNVVLIDEADLKRQSSRYEHSSYGPELLLTLVDALHHCVAWNSLKFERLVVVCRSCVSPNFKA